MKAYILAAIVLGVFSVSLTQAETLQPTLNTPAPIGGSAGAPGTATPTPYPQVTVPGVPHTTEAGNPPLLPKIPQPGPPKEDEPLPELQPKTSTQGNP
jgi:hypothetical protein